MKTSLKIKLLLEETNPTDVAMATEVDAELIQRLFNGQLRINELTLGDAEKLSDTTTFAS